MKKNCLICCLCLLLGASCSKNEPNEISDDMVVPFADPNFEKFCLEKLDANKDGRITVGEVAYLKEFGMLTTNIVSLGGIEYFASLERLYLVGQGCGPDLYNGTLETLDVSRNRNLIELQCIGNRVRSLNVSRNTALKILVCDYNILINIDLSYNKSLQVVSCGNNQLSELDLRNSPELRTVSFRKNNPGIRLKINWLQTPNINCDKTAVIDVEGDEIISFKSGFVKERLLDILRNTEDREAEISRHEACYVTYLDLWCDEVETLDDWRHLLNLRYCYIGAIDRTKCSIASFEGLKNCRNLYKLMIWNIPASDLDLSVFAGLEELQCSATDVVSLDISNNALLRMVDCSESPLLKEVWMKNKTQKDRIQSLQLDPHTIVKYKEDH